MESSNFDILRLGITYHKVQKKAQKRASYSYRTATTIYPCYVPILGDSTGAGRMRLAQGTNVEILLNNQIKYWNDTCFLILYQ